MSSRSLCLRTEVSAEEIRILKIHDWKLSTKNSQIELGDRAISGAETDQPLAKRRTFRRYSDNPETRHRDDTGWLGREDLNSRIQRTGRLFWRTVYRHSDVVGAQYSLQKRLDFCRGWSVSVAVLIRAAWSCLDPAPLAMPPLWGFCGDGA